ncbi:carbohydrate ABC transporter permease [Vallitaleaceae bacterium 9-2]
MAKTRTIGEETILHLRIRQTFAYIFLGILTFACLFPFYILIVNSTRAHPQIQKGFSFWIGQSFVNNLRNVLSNENLPVIRGVLNSLFISSMSALFSTYFSALTAFGIHAYDFRFKKALFSFILMIMMVPVQVSTLGFIQLMNTFHLMDTYFPLIVPTIAAPAVFFFMKQYMESILPVAIVEAARIDGAHEFYTFNKIVLPIMKPAMAVQGIFAFVTAWNNFFLPALIIETKEKKTLPILISQLRSADFLRFDMGQVYILITIAIIPVAIVYLFLSKFIIQGIAMGSVKG